MKTNLDRPFIDCFGKEIAGRSIADALCAQLFSVSALGGTPLTAERKYDAYKLCRRIAENPSGVELSVEERTLVKRVAAEGLSAGAYGQVADILENNEEEQVKP